MLLATKKGEVNSEVLQLWLMYHCPTERLPSLEPVPCSLTPTCRDHRLLAVNIVGLVERARAKSDEQMQAKHSAKTISYLRLAKAT